MKKSIRLMIPGLLAVTLLGAGCIKKPVINYEEGFFADSVVNFSQVNSAFDDYNSAGPSTITYSFPLVFSSNRATQGKKFDLVNYEVWLSFNQETGALNISSYEDQAFPYYYITDLSNTEYNEFGPFNSYLGAMGYLFLFSSDRTGNMEIYASYFTEYSFSGVSPIDPTPFRVRGLNSEHYDAYATLDAQLKQVIFASNRDGGLDLYRVRLDDDVDYYSWAMEDTVYSAERLEVLNSPADDMFPYINGNTIVFSSKREGGYGGYDLYYSVYNGTEWGTPVNFGSKINSASDEYRPVLFLAPYYSNNLLLFSSDRPGGKGGVDLYYTGIPKELK